MNIIRTLKFVDSREESTGYILIHHHYPIAVFFPFFVSASFPAVETVAN